MNPTRIALLLIATAGLALLGCDRPQAECRQALAELDQLPFTPESRYQQRGELYYECGDYLNAIAEFDRAIAVNPNFVVAYVGRARARLERNQLDLALADANQAILIAANPPSHPGFNSTYLYYNLRGIIYQAQKNYQAAIADFQSIHPPSTPASRASPTATPTTIAPSPTKPWATATKPAPI
ncbi:MAG: tetratricopeptide repeat protein [Spirulinaceae cyanobacterium RM2_2_10]|nr:tetratricopeptide repeat protein [Spirulinaceae cyanobacterium RM2_2_10]